MAQIEMDWPVSLSLFGQKQGRMQRAERSPLCPVFGTCAGAQVALQRCPILRTSIISVPCPLCHPCQRGHLYFAQMGTFLLCIDSSKTGEC